jgi:hypothetical protein
MSKTVLHVVPHDDHWAVKREGNERVSSTHPTQKDAIDAAREMAKEQDDIVIHRPDGTIRERVTYFGTNGQSRAEPESAHKAPRSEPTPVRPEDVLGVRSRVSWSAVFAGAVIAVAAYFALTLLALAIGTSLVDRMSGRTLTVSAAVTPGIILLVSMFVGGLVASHVTAGENMREAAVYGVLVWGAVSLGLVAWGLSLGADYATALARTTPGRVAPAPDSALPAERVKQELGLSEQQAQHYTELVEANRATAAADAKGAAWWTFAGVGLSLLAAIAGALFGCGPAPVLRRTSDTRTTVAVVPQPG